MVNKNKSHTGMNFSKVIGCILAVLFIAWPCSAGVVIGELNVGSDYEVQRIDYPVVLGTLNLYPGAEVYSGILALSGSKINFYGGQMSQGSYIIAFSSSINPKITVHGRNFAVNDETLDPLQTSFDLDFSRPYHTLSGFYGNGDEINLKFRGNIPIYLVVLESGIVIDIKPGNEQNNINLKSKGVVPVAVLTTEQFDAATVNPATALFVGAAPEHWSFEDVDGDGDDDIIFHFRTQQLDLNQDSTEATLTAQLASTPLMSQMTSQSEAQISGGTVVSGTDAVKIVAAKKSKK
jgi:hypothetical protein